MRKLNVTQFLIKIIKNITSFKYIIILTNQTQSAIIHNILLPSQSNKIFQKFKFLIPRICYLNFKQELQSSTEKNFALDWKISQPRVTILQFQFMRSHQVKWSLLISNYRGPKKNRSLSIWYDICWPKNKFKDGSKRGQTYLLTPKQKHRSLYNCSGCLVFPPTIQLSHR